MTKTIKVNGFEFGATGNGYVPLRELAGLYLALRAIDGDQLARDILDAAGTIISDINGNQIYPIMEQQVERVARLQEKYGKDWQEHL